MLEAAVIIIKNSNNEYLLLKRKSKPFGYGLVGGKINKDESIIQGLLREIIEEINIELSEKDLYFIKKDKSINGRTVHVFGCNKIINDIKLSNEHSGYVFTSDFSKINLAGSTLSFLSI